ncbi:YqgE/AlgH family protein [Proteus mirabilis]
MNLLNHFLIAMPSLSDPLFQRSVVYVCEHNENGAMGLVINKPIEDISIESVLEQLEIFSADEIVRLAYKTGYVWWPCSGRAWFYLTHPCFWF